MTRVRRLLCSESGIALPVSISTLSLMGVMAALFFAGAHQVSGSSTRDSNSKRALQAAQAGLEVAEERLERVRPGDGQCLADGPQAPDMAGQCSPSSPEDLGGGASFRYTVTPVLGLTDPCRAPLPSAPPLKPGMHVRCITSVGQVNGVTRRVQSRVAQDLLFAFDGMFGRDRVSQSNSSTIYGDLTRTVLGDLATNGDGYRVGPSTQRYIYLGGPDATATGFSPSQVKSEPDPFGLPPVPFEPAENANDNAKLATLPSSTWDPATHELTLGSGDVVALDSGVYHVCRLRTSQSSKLLVKPGNAVRIYVDSPERDSDSEDPESSCGSAGGAAGTATGTLSFEQSSTVAACSVLAGPICTPGSAANLLVFAYGRRSIDPDIALANSGARVLGLYAPRSRIELGNNSDFQGGIVGAEIEISNNMDILFDPSLKLVSDGPYNRQLWAECRSIPPEPADPESGC